MKKKYNTQITKKEAKAFFEFFEMAQQWAADTPYFVEELAELPDNKPLNSLLRKLDKIMKSKR